MLRVEAHSSSADEPDHRALTSLRWENPVLFEKHKVNNFNKTAVPSGSLAAAISKKKCFLIIIFFLLVSIEVVSVSLTAIQEINFKKKKNRAGQEQK